MLCGHFFEAPPELTGETIEVRFDPLDRSQVEIYFRGEVNAMARPVDAVVNAQLPSPQLALAPAPKTTGINFVELLQHKSQPSSPDQEYDEDEDKEDKEDKKE